MFIKYWSFFVDGDEERDTGLLNSARYLMQEGILEKEHIEKLTENLNWFKENLPKRPKFPKVKGAFDNPIVWLKAEAKEHRERMQEIAQVLEENEVLVEILEVEKPGKIIYEDDFQVVAIPFAGKFQSP